MAEGRAWCVCVLYLICDQRGSRTDSSLSIDYVLVGNKPPSKSTQKTDKCSSKTSAEDHIIIGLIWTAWNACDMSAKDVAIFLLPVYYMWNSVYYTRNLAPRHRRSANSCNTKI